MVVETRRMEGGEDWRQAVRGPLWEEWGDAPPEEGAWTAAAQSAKRNADLAVVVRCVEEANVFNVVLAKVRADIVVHAHPHRRQLPQPLEETGAAAGGRA